MSRDNLDIFCGSVCRDHLTDAVTTGLGEVTINSPVGFDVLVSFDFALNCNRQIGTDVADIGEVECGVLIFHTSSISRLRRKNEKNRMAR